jgi:hypothetical protein
MTQLAWAFGVNLFVDVETMTVLGCAPVGGRWSRVESGSFQDGSMLCSY